MERFQIFSHTSWFKRSLASKNSSNFLYFVPEKEIFKNWASFLFILCSKNKTKITKIVHSLKLNLDFLQLMFYYTNTSPKIAYTPCRLITVILYSLDDRLLRLCLYYLTYLVKGIKPLGKFVHDSP